MYLAISASRDVLSIRKKNRKSTLNSLNEKAKYRKMDPKQDDNRSKSQQKQAKTSLKVTCVIKTERMRIKSSCCEQFS